MEWAYLHGSVGKAVNVVKGKKKAESPAMRNGTGDHEAL